MNEEYNQTTDISVEQQETAPVVETAIQYDQDQSVTITEAAKINGVTRQAIYVAIKQDKLKAQKDSTRWTISLRDLEEYRRNKYSRSKSTFDGELIFDNNKGYYSVNQVAKILGVPAQKIYYATRVNMLKATRKGAAWVINEEELNSYREAFLSKKNGRRKTAG